MVKRSYPKPLSNIPITKEITTSEVIAKANISQAGPVVYANHVQIQITINDLVLDFYRISPKPGDMNDHEAFLVQRIIIPTTLVKGLVSALVNVVRAFERDTSITLIDARGKREADELNLWEQTPDTPSEQ